MKSSFYGIIFVLLALSCISLAAPKPVEVQGPNQWTLETTFTPLRQIVLNQAVDNKPVRFWYTIITVTNNSGKDVSFYPKCELVTDTFQVIPAGKGVGSLVYDGIKNRHKRQYPFLELLGTSENKILEGEDNTKDIVIIWPDFDPEAKSVNLFITGLSNETVEVQYPVTFSGQGEEQNKVYLRKTLNLQYKIKGNPASIGGEALEYKGKSWVMR